MAHIANIKARIAKLPHVTLVRDDDSQSYYGQAMYWVEVRRLDVHVCKYVHCSQSVDGVDALLKEIEATPLDEYIAQIVKTMKAERGYAFQTWTRERIYA